MSDVRWLAVRCCCAPRKIFGFLRVPLDRLHVVASRVWAPGSVQVKDAAGAPHALELRLSCEYRHDSELAGKPKATDELAIYSDDRPIEFWRTIPGFVEAASGEGEGR